MISDLLTKSWTAQVLTETPDAGGALVRSYATDLTIGSIAGSEIAPALEAANWTATNGWSAGSGQLVRVNNANTGTITPSGTFAITAGVTYRVVLTVSAVSGPITYTLGGTAGTALTAATVTEDIIAATTGKIIFSGIATKTCTITALSVIPLSTGVFLAHSRRLSASEINARSKQEIVCTHRLYCTVSGITEKHRLSDPDGHKWDVIAVDNPHDMDEFYQIDLSRADVERTDDT